MDLSPDSNVRVTARLAQAGCVAPKEEAGLLGDAARDEGELDDFVRRREAGEPLAWIVGHVTFCGRHVNVAPGVYVPRVQSEELACRAATRLAQCADQESRPVRALELCAGAGAIAHHLAVEVPEATIIAADLDARAVACARSNGLATVCADLAAPVVSESLDLLVAVAPYVPTGHIDLLPTDVRRYEPHRALDGGNDGLSIVRRVVTEASRVLRPDGWLLIEIGGDQDHQVACDLDEAGFTSIDAWHDEDGDLRGIEARAQRLHCEQGAAIG